MDADDKRESSISKKSTGYKNYDPSLMEKAIAAVQHEGMTMYRAAKDFGVPTNTLRDRLAAKGVLKHKRSSFTKQAIAARRNRILREHSKLLCTVDEDMAEKWHGIGKSEGLTSNAAITRFLISLYYQTTHKEESKTDIRCRQCQNPLTLFCNKCQLISQSTPTTQQISPSQSAENTHGSSVPDNPAGQVPPLLTDSSIIDDVKNASEPQPRRSARRRKLTRLYKRTKKPKVAASPSDNEQFRFDDEENFLHNSDMPDIKNTTRVEDSVGPKDSPSFSLDELFNSFEEESQKKTKIRTHECPQCDKIFLDMQQLKDHFEETKHISEYLCQQCSKSFKNKSALRQHCRVHNRQEHQCATCGLSFKFPSRLNKHIKTHGSDKPHVCDKCGKSFVSVYYLRDHIKIHSEERRYKCGQCDAAFKQKPALYAHMKKHTQEKPYQCQYCGLKFRDSQKVKIHVRTHTGEKPYKCGMCEASFVSNSNMWQHCAYVHGKSTKTHQCPKCPLTFAAKGKLKVHIKNSHASLVEEGEAEIEGDGEGEENTEAASCQYEMMRQTIQPVYIEIHGTNQLVQI